MSLERKMARQKRYRDKTIKKGTPYRRLIAVNGRAVHATKGRGHPLATLEYRSSQIMQALGIPAQLSGAA